VGGAGAAAGVADVARALVVGGALLVDAQALVDEAVAGVVLGVAHLELDGERGDVGEGGLDVVLVVGEARAGGAAGGGDAVELGVVAGGDADDVGADAVGGVEV